MKTRFPVLIGVLSLIAISSVGACGSDADSPPGACGNGTVETAAGEVCDGANLAGATCASATMGAMSSGNLGCSSDCRSFVTSTCTGSGGPGSGGGPGTGTGTGGGP